MSIEAKPYPRVLWEAFTEGEPGQCGYDGLSDRCRRRCDRGAEAVIAAYEEDRRKDTDAALAAVGAQLRQVWKLVNAILGVTGTGGCGPAEDDAAFPAGAAAPGSELSEDPVTPANPGPGRDLVNAQLVGRNGYGEISMALPRVRMTRDEALVHAAWLVVIAGGELEIGGIIAAICGAR